jgi:hypothetical protein
MNDEFRAFCRMRMDPDDAQAVAFWRDLASFCYADASTLVPGDPQSTAFCEGKRTVFLMLARAAELPLWGKRDAEH